ncbi:class I SAM-dependent methyltransferase [Salinimicrobium catena]|uniref:THUMP-like domain-containing protein n=1 Tax=Salinimicrobium catena TaxID=390640 RepID=UPI002FE43CC2
MNNALLHKEVQIYLEENFREDVSKIVFKGSPFPCVSAQELAVQLTGKKKAEKKLPTWFKTRGIIYPPTLNLEQTSSETTAAYKASLIEGNSIVDVTGGFGIDSYFFSRNFQRVIHCELNEELSEIASHNFEVLGAENVSVYLGNGIEFIRNSFELFNWIYIDPSRRDDAGGRVFQLSDCLPNVPENIDLLLEKGKNILIKTSPLLDMKAGLRELKNVHEIHIVAVENDVKELLWILKQEPSEEIKIKTINFGKKERQVYENYWGNEHTVRFSEPLAYLYEPNAAVMKSGLFDAISEDFALLKLHTNSHLYTSKELKDFPGRRFHVLKTLPFKKKKLKAELDLKKAHITTRNFSESVASLRKQLKLKDGGEHYLFFTTLKSEEKIVLVCKKV